MHKVVMAFFVVGFAACLTPLQIAIRKTLPTEYAENLPATSSPSLGVMVDGSAKINNCYSGSLDTPKTSWSSVVATYDSATTAVLKADLGDSVDVKVAGSAKVAYSGNVTLLETSVIQLNDLFFLPVSQCAITYRAGYSSPSGRRDQVVVRAVRAGSIQADDSLTAGGKVEVKIPTSAPVKIDGAAQSETAVAFNQKGTGLYYAVEIKEVVTRLYELTPHEKKKIGEPTSKVGPCRVLLTSANSESWLGSLSCDDGAPHKLEGHLGETSYVRAEKGVSYSVTVTSTDLPGIFEIEYARWVVDA